MRVKRLVNFEVPRVPNYLIQSMPVGQRQDGFKEAPKVSIAELTDDELREVGTLWTTALLNRASEIRRGGK